MSHLAKLTLGIVLLAFVCSLVAVRASADPGLCIIGKRCPPCAPYDARHAGCGPSGQ